MPGASPWSARARPPRPVRSDPAPGSRPRPGPGDVGGEEPPDGGRARVPGAAAGGRQHGVPPERAQRGQIARAVGRRVPSAAMRTGPRTQVAPGRILHGGHGALSPGRARRGRITPRVKELASLAERGGADAGHRTTSGATSGPSSSYGALLRDRAWWMPTCSEVVERSAGVQRALVGIVGEGMERWPTRPGSASSPSDESRSRLALAPRWPATLARASTPWRPLPRTHRAHTKTKTAGLARSRRCASAKTEVDGQLGMLVGPEGRDLRHRDAADPAAHRADPGSRGRRRPMDWADLGPLAALAGGAPRMRRAHWLAGSAARPPPPRGVGRTLMTPCPRASPPGARVRQSGRGAPSTISRAVSGMASCVERREIEAHISPRCLSPPRAPARRHRAGGSTHSFSTSTRVPRVSRRSWWTAAMGPVETLPRGRAGKAGPACVAATPARRVGGRRWARSARLFHQPGPPAQHDRHHHLGARRTPKRGASRSSRAARSRRWTRRACARVLDAGPASRAARHPRAHGGMPIPASHRVSGGAGDDFTSLRPRATPLASRRCWTMAAPPRHHARVQRLPGAASGLASAGAALGFLVRPLHGRYGWARRAVRDHAWRELERARSLPPQRGFHRCPAATDSTVVSRHRGCGGLRRGGGDGDRQQGRRRCALLARGRSVFWGSGSQRLQRPCPSSAARFGLGRTTERLFGTSGFPGGRHTLRDTIDKLDGEVLARDTTRSTWRPRCGSDAPVRC